MFVDEVLITVEAGNGGHGCLSFRREKFLTNGGPDGGNGGHGGNVFVVGDYTRNTLIYFRYHPFYKAENGYPGRSRKMSGRNGNDLYIKVPVGTMLTDINTREILIDITKAGEPIKIAQGGHPGLGNLKSSRAPLTGSKGERRKLRLELKLMASVGLLGTPNTGKSTLIRSISAAQPKVADFPFTTIVPNIGVVKIGEHENFVLADVPGMIEGGLGLRFIKHITRTQLLFHIIDAVPLDDSDPVTSARLILSEVSQLSSTIATRWLVLNKLDMVPLVDRQALVEDIVARLEWTGPVFKISALRHLGCDELVRSAHRWLWRRRWQKRQSA